jgi:hypothetical protein
MGLKTGGTRGSLRNLSTAGGQIPDEVIEDFEWGGPMSNRYITIDSSKDGLSVSSDTTLEGNYLLSESSTTEDYGRIEDYADYPGTTRGELYAVDMMYSGGVQTRPYLFIQAEESSHGTIKGYGVRFYPDADNFNLYRFDDGAGGGVGTQLASASNVGLSADTVYTITLIHQADNTVEAELYEGGLGGYGGSEHQDPRDVSADASISATDDTYTSGTFGFQEERGGPADTLIDYYRRVY